MKLPPLRKTVEIRFWSLRNGVGQGMGVMFDIDTIVDREAYRKKTDDGWTWQIRGLNKLSEWDYFAYSDQCVLDECAEDMSGIEILILHD